MKLLALSVEHFRCVKKSRVEFGRGLNVLYGPNDLGKSSLAAAIRAALMLQTSSRESEEFVSWHSSGDPHVELVFESEPQRIWRIKKTFGNHPQAFLEESRDGVDFHVEARGRDVDGRLSEILRWGLTPPGGKGRPKGMPVTFLSTALLAEQDEVGAIFSKALSGDSDESGKKRLVEAVKAAAEDPLFKSVLHIVQARVDEAFASSGQRRRGKDSPWIKLRERIRLAEDDERQCREQLHKTASIENDLQELMSRRMECEAALAKALETLRSAEDERNKAIRRAEIGLRLQASQDHLHEIVLAIQQCEQVKSQHEELTQIAERLVEREKEAQSSLTGAARRVETAREDVQVSSADQARERQLKQNTLEKNRAELLSEQLRNNAAVSRVQAIEAIAGRTRSIETTTLEVAKTIGELKIQHAEAVKALEKLDEGEAELRGIAQLIRGNRARAGIDEAGKALTQIEAWREQSSHHRNEALAIEIARDKIELPTAEHIELLKGLEHQIQIVRASVGVGLHLALRPKRELNISIRRDGGEIERWGAKGESFEVVATGKMQIDIDDIVEIGVTGGQKSAREEAVRLETRWTVEAEPVLKLAGLTNLDDLLAATKARAKSAEEIRKLREAAEALDQRVLDQRDWRAILVEQQRELASAETGLASKDRKQLETVMLKLRIDDLTAVETHLAQLNDQRPKVIERERIVEGKLAAARARSEEKQDDLTTARQELLAAQSAVENYSSHLLTRLLGEQSTLVAKLTRAEQDLQTLDAETDSALAVARGALATAEAEHSGAEATHRKITDEWRIAEKKKDNAEGELRILSEAAAKLDEGSARQAVVATEVEMASVPHPLHDVTEEMLAELRFIATSAQEELSDMEGAIKEKRGALKHVGGQVAKARTEDAEEALTLLREKERDLEVDYEAWALLREMLLEAEQEEGVHLGKVLGGPIVERFAELTAGRYGELALGPDLETDTISVGGESRLVGALSVGTRDQLSIIFRLTLAEQLRSAVVLDDQLTQSDAERMVWLRNLIKQMAASIQIIVFTCRPADYLSPAELKASKRPEHFSATVRSVDLAQMIERSGHKTSVRSSVSPG